MISTAIQGWFILSFWISHVTTYGEKEMKLEVKKAIKVAIPHLMGR